MNVIRFLKKCLTDRPAAWRSMRLVMRSVYGQIHWALRPDVPICYRIPSGGLLLLERDHSFTQAFWPGVDQYEPDVRAALLHFLKPGDVFVDCGANIGYFSVLAGHLVSPMGKVIAIEANPLTQPLLDRNLRLNGFGKIVRCALASSAGDLELFMPRAGDAYSSMRTGGLVTGTDIKRFPVPGRTLDEVVSSLSLQRLDLIKIDIEGAELDVLRSAKRVMRELRPMIICEYGANTWPAFGARKEDLLLLLKQWNYRVGIFDPTTKQINPVSERVWISAYANLVLFPLERDDSVKWRDPCIKSVVSGGEVTQAPSSVRTKW
jgi:FkbM family methyltransferase